MKIITVEYLIQERIKKLGINQSEFARILRVNNRTVGRWISFPDTIPYSVIICLYYWEKYGIPRDLILLEHIRQAEKLEKKWLGVHFEKSRDK